MMTSSLCEECKPLIAIVGEGKRAHESYRIIHEATHQRCLQWKTPQEALVALKDWSDDSSCLSLIILAVDTHVDDFVRCAQDYHAAKNSHFIIITLSSEISHISYAIDQGLVLAVLREPLIDDVLLGHIYTFMSTWIPHHIHEADRIKELLDVWTCSDDTHDLLSQLRHTSQELVPILLQGIEEVLGPRPRLKLPPDVRLTQRDRPVDAIYLVLEGTVNLSQDEGEGHNVLLHHASSGPLIGLMALTKNSVASFTARTTSDVTVVRMTMDQLHRVLTERPSIAILLSVTAMRALSDRLIRAEQLHIEKEELSEALEKEHERAAYIAEEKLQEARDELVEAARFAMLGELAAGIAHELNNPVAAITRAADHVGSALETILSDNEELRGGLKPLQHARSGKQLTTKETRHYVRELMPLVGSREKAYRLVSCGIYQPQEAQIAMASEKAFSLREQSVKIGTAVRDIDVASRRIIGLVQSLRSYSRSDAQPVDNIDIHQGIEDTLRLSAPRLHNITIEKHYDEHLPHIRAFPSRLEQVWTNIIINAAEAMEQATGEAAKRQHLLTITTSQTNDKVRVDISDNGPGIPSQIRQHIFTPHFTTKQGTVHYGLGMGLGIVRQILDAHSGMIEVQSSPQGTTMSVFLPIHGPSEKLREEYLHQSKHSQ